MSYYINTEGKTITLKKKNHNHSKAKNNMNNINDIYNLSHPFNCKCKCHNQNIRYTTSNQPNNYDSEINTNVRKYQNLCNNLSNNNNRIRNKSMNYLIASGNKGRYTTNYNYDYDYSSLDNKEIEDTKNKTENINKKLNVIKTGKDNLIKASVIYKNKIQPLYTLDIGKKELSTYYHDAIPKKYSYGGNILKIAQNTNNHSYKEIIQKSSSKDKIVHKSLLFDFNKNNIKSPCMNNKKNFDDTYNYTYNYDYRNNLSTTNSPYYMQSRIDFALSETNNNETNNNNNNNNSNNDNNDNKILNIKQIKKTVSEKFFKNNHKILNDNNNIKIKNDVNNNSINNNAINNNVINNNVNNNTNNNVNNDANNNIDYFIEENNKNNDNNFNEDIKYENNYYKKVNTNNIKNDYLLKKENNNNKINEKFADINDLLLEKKNDNINNQKNCLNNVNYNYNYNKKSKENIGNIQKSRSLDNFTNLKKYYSSNSYKNKKGNLIDELSYDHFKLKVKLGLLKRQIYFNDKIGYNKIRLNNDFYLQDKTYVENELNKNKKKLTTENLLLEKTKKILEEKRSQKERRNKIRNKNVSKNENKALYSIKKNLVENNKKNDKYVLNNKFNFF